MKNKKTFRAECQLGEFKSYGKGSTKKMAKHEAARFMVRNLRGDFIDKTIKKMLE